MKIVIRCEWTNGLIILQILESLEADSYCRKLGLANRLQSIYCIVEAYSHSGPLSPLPSQQLASSPPPLHHHPHQVVPNLIPSPSTTFPSSHMATMPHITASASHDSHHQHNIIATSSMPHVTSSPHIACQPLHNHHQQQQQIVVASSAMNSAAAVIPPTGQVPPSHHHHHLTTSVSSHDHLSQMTPLQHLSSPSPQYQHHHSGSSSTSSAHSSSQLSELWNLLAHSGGGGGGDNEGGGDGGYWTEWQAWWPWCA